MESIRAEGIELGFASPGADETILITDLIAALHAATIADKVSALAAFRKSHALREISCEVLP